MGEKANPLRGRSGLIGRSEGRSPLCIVEKKSVGHHSKGILVVEMVALYYRVKQKNLAKFSDTCSVRADGLCIG